MPKVESSASERRSSRIKTFTRLPGPSLIAMQLFNKGFHAFNAKSAINGDGGGETTSVTLSLYDLDDDLADSWEGNTDKKHGCGHAEMDALAQYVATGNNTFENMVLSCTTKPCCVRCSAVLGLLGIEACDRTLKYSKPMGSTEWGISDSVAKAVANHIGRDDVSYLDIKDFGGLTLK